MLVTGRSRLLLHVAAYALAQALDGDFYWVQVGDPARPPDPDDGRVARSVPDERLVRVDDPDEMLPDLALAHLGLWTLVQRDESPGEVDPLVDYLLLPPPIQRLLGSVGLSKRAAAFVVANVERFALRFPVRDADPRRLHALVKRENVSAVLTLRGRPDPAFSSVVDAVFRVEAEHAQRPGDARLIPERLPAGAEWALESPRSFREVAPLRAALDRIVPS